MTQITTTASKDTTSQTSAASNLLAMLKSGIGAGTSAAGDLFSSLLSEVKVQSDGGRQSGSSNSNQDSDAKSSSSGTASTSKTTSSSSGTTFETLGVSKQTSAQAARSQHSSDTTDATSSKATSSKTDQTETQPQEKTQASSKEDKAEKTQEAQASEEEGEEVVSTATAQETASEETIHVEKLNTKQADSSKKDEISSSDDSEEGDSEQKVSLDANAAGAAQAAMVVAQQLVKAENKNTGIEASSSTDQKDQAEETEADPLAIGSATSSSGGKKNAEGHQELAKASSSGVEGVSAGTLAASSSAGQDQDLSFGDQSSGQGTQAKASSSDGLTKGSSSPSSESGAFLNLFQNGAAVASASAGGYQVSPSTTSASQGAAASASEIGAVGSSQSGATSSSSSTAVLSDGLRSAASYDFASKLSAASEAPSSKTQLSVVEQVAVQLRKQAKDGTEQMTIHLRPSDMGKIEVTLKFSSDNQVTGTVVADSQATLDLLSKDVGSLQRALQDAGLRADSGCLQFSLSGGGQQGGNNAYAYASSASSSSLRSGLSVDEETVSSVDASMVETYVVTPGRVNLSV